MRQSQILKYLLLLVTSNSWLTALKVAGKLHCLIEPIYSRVSVLIPRPKDVKAEVGGQGPGSQKQKVRFEV